MKKRRFRCHKCQQVVPESKMLYENTFWCASCCNNEHKGATSPMRTKLPGYCDPSALIESWVP